ncbi:MAG: 6,7-dimethyl-8-ribityllumazine synthase [Pedosphaera sp.]|nr:6,7-dimethyl-8-ribityllumazine synthase [Pedosphaera sp.]
MLKRIKTAGSFSANGTFAIVASKYNARFVDSMVRAATAELKRAGAKVRIVRVPGAFEIPAVAAKLADSTLSSQLSTRPSAIICLGVIFQGQTSHAQHIGWGVTHALAQIQILHRLPVIHGVFVFEKQEHARVRCLGRKHNRGREAAHTALAMAKIMAGLEPRTF